MQILVGILLFWNLLLSFISLTAVLACKKNSDDIEVLKTMKLERKARNGSWGCTANFIHNQLQNFKDLPEKEQERIIQKILGIDDKGD